VGCCLCAAVCPSEAIYVEAAENTPENRVSPGERYAKTYQIHLLRCIYCGFCEEACPEDAIVMGPEYELAKDARAKLILTKEQMLTPVEEGFGEYPELPKAKTG
jgi:NADH-quinone oxidoreductase subunit I